MSEMISQFYEKQVVLGKEAKNQEYIKKVDGVAENILKQNILNPKNESDKKSQYGRAEYLVNSLGGQGEFRANSVEGLKNVLKDDEKTETQKEIAQERLSILEKGVFIVMRWSGDEKLQDLLGRGSAVEIDNILPTPLRGLGERVVKNIISNEVILNKLKDLDDVRENCDLNNPTDRQLMLGEISQAYADLTRIKGLSPEEKEQLYTVKAYLNAEMQTMDDDSKTSEKKTEENNTSNKQDEKSDEVKSGSTIDTTGDPEIKEYLKAQAEYAQSRAILEKQIEKVSLNEILDSYLLIRAPRERAPQMWEYRVPEFMEGMSQEKWRKLLSFEDAWLGAIYGKRGTSEYNNSLEKMKDGILNLKSLTEADLKTWYEDKTLNLKGVMHEISRELVTKKTTTEGDQTRTIYAFETGLEKDPKTEKEREVYIGSNVKKFVDNEDIYKLALVKRLVEKKIVSNEEVAKLAVALSMDIMEMGGVFSVADGLRKLSWESDAVRLAQRPERKYSLKVGSGELFAGPWTELANTLSQGDPKKAVELVKSWGVVPELLSGSFLDQQLELGDGKRTEKTMMEMIYNNEEIPFNKKENDMFFGWRKDHIMPAARMWMYISNKTPLEFSRNRESDTVISQWRTDLYNDVLTLRRNKDCIVSTEVIQGAIGGSVGLWPFNGPYLRIGEADTAIKYASEAIEVVRQLGLNNEESSKIYDFFGVDRKYFRDFNLKYVSYGIFRNRTIRERVRNTALKDTLRPRK